MAKCTIQVQTRDLRFRISSNFAKLIFKMSITIFVQNKCKNSASDRHSDVIIYLKNDQICGKMYYSSANSRSDCQNHIKFWQYNPTYQINRQLENSASNSISDYSCDVIVYLKMDEFVLKCASRDQIPHITGILHGNITSPSCSNGITQISFCWFFIDIGVGIVSKYIF